MQGGLASLAVGRFAKKLRQRGEGIAEMQRAQGLQGFSAHRRIRIGKRLPNDSEAAPVRGATSSGCGGSPHQGGRMAGQLLDRSKHLVDHDLAQR